VILHRWKGRRGRRPQVVLCHLEAFFFILRTGAPWRELPAQFGKWKTVYSQFRRWCRCGLWMALVEWFNSQAKGTLRHVDGSYIKLHQHGLQGCRKTRTEEAIGLSRGGMTTKLLAVVDEEGQLCHFALTSGNVHDLTFARQMLGSFARIHFVGDKGFDSQVFRAELVSHGATGSTIPRKGYATMEEQPEPFDPKIYKKRHLVENFFQRMKLHKRVALRSEKTAASLHGFITFAALLDRAART
jgi:transposase